MRLAFAELKKVEITDRNRKAAATAERNKKEAQALEESGLNHHQRQREE